MLRLKAPFNLWCVGEHDEISRLAKLDPGFNKNTTAAIRDRIVKSLFEELSSEEKKEWAICTAELYNEEKINYAHHMKEGPSTWPEDRQMYVQWSNLRSTISLNPTKASGNTDKSNALPKSSEEYTTPMTTIVGSTPVIQPTIQPDMTLLATIPTCLTLGGIGTGDDGNGGDGENETEVDEPGTASPILGFPSMFDLPPSPVLCFDELPVSQFTSPEISGDNPVPAPAPATSISASTASQGAITLLLDSNASSLS